MAELYAREKGIKLTIFPADWEKYGKSAGMIRNKDIINNCDVCVAFWDGISKGTKNSISLAQKTKQNGIYKKYRFRGLKWRKL